MEVSTLATIILATTIILFAIDRYPLALVSIASLLAMVLTGVLPFADAFKGFSSNLVVLVAGMMVIGSALFDNNVIGRVGNLIFKHVKGGEKAFLLLMMTMAAVLSGFLHNISVMAMMTPLAASYVAKSNGEMKLKNFYMALAHATIIGARFTLIGASPPMLAQSVLLSSEGVERGLGFFELAAVAVPVFIVVLLCYHFFLYRIGNRVFDHTKTNEVNTNVESKDIPIWKTWVTGIVMVVVAVCFVFVDAVPLGVIAMTGACVLMFTGCASWKESLKKLDWSTLIILACTDGITACFSLTGLGDIIVDFLTRVGAGTSSPFLLVVIFSFVTAWATNVLANSSATVIFSSLAVSVALGLGMDPIPLVVAVVFGGAFDFIMPTATSTLTMSCAAGYSFRDYAVVGGILSPICCATSALVIGLVYHLI